MDPVLVTQTDLFPGAPESQKSFFGSNRPLRRKRDGARTTEYGTVP